MRRYHGGRRCPRLREYDYSTPGIYFITFCTARRSRRLSTVVGRKTHLSQDGRCAVASWRALLRHLPEVHVLAATVMPDHVHTVLHLRGDVSARKPISEIVGAMKSASAAAINRARGTPGCLVWQRSFYDTVVRTPGELERIWRYIADNPGRWSAREGRTQLSENAKNCLFLLGPGPKRSTAL
jgi:REP-associated tyrosine transposase